MAHNLNSVNGRTAMMFRGDAPWHNLGTKAESRFDSATFGSGARLKAEAYGLAVETVQKMT